MCLTSLMLHLMLHVLSFVNYTLRSKESLIQTVVWFEQLRDPMKNVKNTNFDDLIYSLI